MIAGTFAVTTALLVAPPAGADPMSDLTDLLPPGYAEDSCRPAVPGRALAALTCGADDDGPTSAASYALYREPRERAASFAVTLKDFASLTPCPGAAGSAPTRLPDATGRPLAMIACGLWPTGEAVVLWEALDSGLVALVHGRDLEPLFGWAAEVATAP